MIKAILKGNQKAFKLLVDNYQLMVVNTCHAFVQIGIGGSDLGSG